MMPHLPFAKCMLAISIAFLLQSCKKGDGGSAEVKEPEVPARRCGILLTTPVLDSLRYPTYYITAVVAFPEGQETVHIVDNVTGDHDGSWYLPKYSKDSTYCVAP